jgi:hypothetical protein
VNLSHWSNDGVQHLCNALMQNPFLVKLNLSHCHLDSWFQEGEKFERLLSLIGKNNMIDLDLRHNNLGSAKGAQKQQLRDVTKAALTNGTVCHIHSPRTLTSPGFKGLMRYMFDSPGVSKEALKRKPR